MIKITKLQLKILESRGASGSNQAVSWRAKILVGCDRRQFDSVNSIRNRLTRRGETFAPS